MPCRLLDDTDASDTDTVKLANVMAAPCIISGRYVRARHDEPSAEGSDRDDWAGFKTDLAREGENECEDSITS